MGCEKILPYNGERLFNKKSNYHNTIYHYGSMVKWSALKINLNALEKRRRIETAESREKRDAQEYLKAH